MTEKQDLERLRKLLAYYGGLDKATALALIDRLEVAEQDLVAIKSTQVQHIVTTSYETARTAGIAIDEAVRVVAGWLVDDTDRRAREAERAVRRVREVATAMATHSLPEAPRGGAWETAHGAQIFAKDILEALDGDTRD